MHITLKDYCSISIDVDPIGHYLRARGYGANPETNANAIYDDAMPRFLEVFDEFGVKTAFFMVAPDVKLKSNKAVIRDAHARVHEIANHTYHHHQDFGVRPPEDKKADIVCQEPVPILPEDTFETMYERVIEWTPKLFLQALDKLEKGRTEFQSNPEEEASSYSYPTREDIRKFRKQGLKIW